MASYRVDWAMVHPWIASARTNLKSAELAELATTIREVDHELSSKPFSFGEPFRKLRNAKLVIAIGFHGKLSVHYGINKNARVVFVSKLAWRQSK